MSEEERPARIALVVEDDDQIAYLLRYILQKEGYAVKHARDGREARDLIEAGPPPAVVTLDYMLPHFNGLELLEIMRAQPGWRDVPVVMLTAKSQEKDVTRARHSGATDYLVKPFKPEELRDCIRRLAGAPPA